MATLTRIDGLAAHPEPIPIREKLSIGRSRENTLMIEDNAASRRHARILKREEGYQLVDLGSENGTWVGDRKIQEHWLRSGDRIRIGETIFRFASEAGDTPPAPERSPAVIIGLAAVAMGAGIVIIAASAALWYYWPLSGIRDPAPRPTAVRDCYEVCFRRCRVMGDDRAGPWCNDVACCDKACTSMHGRGDAFLSYRECEDLAKTVP
jgi:hypothetical protein